MKMIKNYYKGSVVKVGRGPNATTAVATAIETATWRSDDEMQRQTIVRALNANLPMSKAVEQANKYRPGYEYALVVVARPVQVAKPEATDRMAKARAAYAAQRALQKAKGTGAAMAHAN